MGIGVGDIKPLKHAFDRGEILCILLGLFQKRRVFRVCQQFPDFAAQGKGRHIFFGGNHIFIDDGGSGFHRVGHLIGNIPPYHGSRVDGYDAPEQQHTKQCDNAGDNTHPGRQFFV